MLENIKSCAELRSFYDNLIASGLLRLGQYYRNISPINGKVIGEFARPSAEDVELALDAAHKAFGKWGRSAAAADGLVAKIALALAAGNGIVLKLAE